MGDNDCTTAASSLDQGEERKDRQTVEYIFPDNGPVDAVRKDEESSVAVEEEKKDRPQWNGKLEFLLACIGHAIGLGNIWRFPYLCYKNGGGAFLVPYIIMLVIIGLPLLYLEIALGQFASLSTITIWRINPLFKGIGFAMIALSWLIALYYNVIISHAIFFFFASMTNPLPWTKCSNSWNTINCSTYNEPYTNRNLSHVNVTGLKTSSEEFYKIHVLQQTPTIDEFGSPNLCLVLCLLLSWILVLLCLIRGVQYLRKLVYVTATLPYIMLTIVLVRGITLEGAMDGVIFYLKPDFARLTDAKVWSDAATQIFFSMSAGTGGFIAISSFNKFRNNCFQDAILISIINCLSGFFAGLVIFSILGFMAFEKGLPVEQVTEKGPGLVFQVYPEALARMPFAPVCSVTFFLVFAILGVGSQFLMVECVMSSLIDEFQLYIKNTFRNFLFRFFIVSLSFLLGIPMVCNGGMFLINLIDFCVSGFPCLVVSLLECLVINYVYGFETFAADIRMMTGKSPKLYWKIMWKFLCPVSLFTITIFNIVFYTEPNLDGILYPKWAKMIGWLIVALPISFIPIWFLYKYCQQGGYHVLRHNLHPSLEWGPAQKEDRINRYSPETLSFHKIRFLEDNSNRNGIGALIQHTSSLSTMNSCIPNSISGSLSSFSNAGSTLTLPTTNESTGSAAPGTRITKSESVL